MARFITLQQQEASIKARSSFIHYLLLAIIIMEIITLPHIPLLGFEPLNLILLFAVFAIAFNLNKLLAINSTIVKAILLVLFFNCYDSVLGWALGKETNQFLIGTFRTTVELSLFAIACTNLKELNRIFMAITIGIFISVMFGLLIYHFGEPYQGIRDWLLQDSTLKLGASGKGFWVSGLSGYHFLFGYVVAAMPVLTLIASQLSRFKWLWYIILILSFYAIYLNAERAAVIGALGGVVFLTIRWRLLKPVFIFLAVTFFLSVYLLKPSNPIQDRALAIKEGTETLQTRLAEHDSTERLHWLKAGVDSVVAHPLTGVSYHQYSESIFDRHLNVINSPDRFTPYAHNHYVNSGLRIGLLGWILMIMYLQIIKNIAKKLFAAAIKNQQRKVLLEGIPLALAAPMLVALFHNGGIFSNEPITVCLTGLLISSYQMLHNKNVKIES